MSALKTVGVVGGQDADDSMEVLTALAESCGLNVRRAQVNEGSSLAGSIVLAGSSEQARTMVPSGRPSIRVITSGAAATGATVHFGTGHQAPMPFRGRSLRTASTVPGERRDAFGEVVATADGLPVWTTASAGGLRHDTCWVPSPWLKKEDCVFDHLKGSRLMNLLPLVEWLRWISGWHEWSQRPLRACFMFDDPNLHSTRYGFVGFELLATEGRSHHYHTSFATVPLDGYYVSSSAARIIRDNRETLSLLIHGNNHTKRELAGCQAPEEQIALMQQAVQRTKRLERKAGLTVSRVMAPPHGVCSAPMMAAMAAAGFEAVCVSHGSVWTGNPGAKWTVSLGAFPALVVAGLPVIPRFGFDRPLENKILLAAYLGQPIVPVAHHWELANGIDILSSTASMINNLGAVVWSDMTAIARTNYRFRVLGHRMRVQTFSRTTTVNVPEGVSELQLEAPWVDPVREVVQCRSSGNGTHPACQALPSAGLRFLVTPGSTVDLVVVRTPGNGEQSPALPSTPFGVIARKVFSELRDRTMPYFPKKFVKH